MNMYVASLAAGVAACSRRASCCRADSVTDIADRRAGAVHRRCRLWRTWLVRWCCAWKKTARLRFKVEDLARELEEARDDALRKRFRGGNRQCLQDRLPGQYEP